MTETPNTAKSIDQSEEHEGESDDDDMELEMELGYPEKKKELSDLSEETETKQFDPEMEEEKRRKEAEEQRRKDAYKFLEDDVIKCQNQSSVKKKKKNIKAEIENAQKEIKNTANKRKKRIQKLEKKRKKEEKKKKKKDHVQLEPLSEKKRAVEEEEEEVIDVSGLDVSVHLDLDNLDSEKGVGEIESPHSMLKVVQEYLDIGDKLEGLSDRNFSIARKDFNKMKNRYKDILPYNHNFVNCTGYLNASWFELNKVPYIACQWPLKKGKVNCEVDFWSSIYQYKVRVIVALQEPGGKHHYYWPTNPYHEPEKKMEKGYCVTVLNRESSGDILDFYRCKVEKKEWTSEAVKKGMGFSKRVAPIKSEGLRSEGLKANLEKKKAHEVCLLVYKKWPDHGIPEEYTTLYELIKKTDELNLKGSLGLPGEPHIVVHCSAGIGRTGVFILAHNILRNGWDTKKIPEVFHAMRKQRYGMIQTAGQYKYVYDFIWKYTEKNK